MRIFIVISLFLTAATLLNAQVLIQWQKCLGGTNMDEANCIKQTADGGYVMSGYTGSNDGDVSGNHGDRDFWVVKVDGFGNNLWQKCYGGTNTDMAYSIEITNDGGYIVAGSTSSNDCDVSGNHSSNFDCWVVKLDSLGNILWQKCLGGTSDDFASSIIQTSDGGFVVAGTAGSDDGDVLGNNGMDNYWVIKLDVSGNIQWRKCFGGSGFDKAKSIVQTIDGGYAVAGNTTSSDVEGFHDLTDYLIVKLDSLGNMQWQKCLGGTNHDEANSIRQTSDGGYIIAGSTYSWDGDISVNHGNYDYWVVKLNNIGNLQWQKCFGGMYNDEAYSIDITNNNEYVITGCTLNNNGDVSGHHGDNDYWVIRIDGMGNLLWQRCFGGTGPDYSYSILRTSDDGYIVAGQSFSFDEDVTGNHGSDIWILKIIQHNLSGYIFNDLNENGIKDSLEQGIAGHLARLMPGNHYTFTNNEGYYYFRGDTGVINTVSYLPQQYWYETTNNYSYYVNLDSLSQVVDTLDYAVKSRVNVNDVSVYITGSPTRTNSETHYWLTYKNWGTVTANGTIEFQYDPILTYTTSTPLSPVSHVGNTLTFEYDTLGPGVQRMMRVDFQVSGVQNLGDTLNSYAMITPLVPDTFVTNNYDTLQQVIVGSYDPNDKTVSPAGYEQWGFVEHGQRLTYTIRFQNTGTDTAFTVIIRDTLDTDLDIETFVVEANSHPVTWQLHSGNELFFTFQNILLPDSNVNEPGSNGFIRYSISPKAGLADGTTATNTSYIFFDYNPAVVTNTTLNTFVTNIPVTSPVLEVLKTLVFPNPSSDFVYINQPEFTRKVEVYNLNGELVQQQVPQKPVAEINIKELPAGVYVVKMKSSKGVVTTKFVKE